MVELHLHLDGALRPQTVWELAQEQGIDLGCKTPEEMPALMQVPADCPSLTVYLEKFAAPLRVLQQASALTRVTRELVQDLAAEGMTYAELRFAPQQSTAQGLTQLAAAQAVEQGAREGMALCPGLRVGIILCCMRGTDNEAANRETIEVTHQLLGDVICAADLAGAEALFPTRNFAPLFARAMELGVPYTIHAGEADGPESIRAALAMGTRRIGHGIYAVQDEALVRELAEQGITLEVCPTSNLQTKGVDNIQNHPIRKLFDAGVRVTVNTDNRTVSNTTLGQEIALLQRELAFTDAEIETMQRYAAEAAFLH